ncbi:glycerophosphodiester phosphodiesterase [Fulvivirga sp. M361]|nr:glycerophosphodiester phosphodiesterase [Fulvivirga sp. M361]
MNSVSFSDNVVIAHRGAWKSGGLPENSIAALRKAIALQCTGSEFDVRMTADDSLIVTHDPNYEGMTIEKVAYDELVAFPLSNGEALPTLRSYIMAGMKQNVTTRLICEIKPSATKGRGQAMAVKVLELVEALNATHMMAYISFDYNILKKIEAINSNAHTQYLKGDRSPSELKIDGINGADYPFPIYKKHPDWIEMARENNISLNVWTVNDSSDINWCLEKGFDYITTNEPELVLKQYISKVQKGILIP